MAIWQLSANYRGVNARGFINGFPVINADTADSGESGFTSSPLNPFLVGKGNLLRVEVTAKGSDPDFNARVADMTPGDIVDSSDKGQITLDNLEYTFDSDEDHFSALLAQAEPTTEDEAVAFALKLRNMLNQRKQKELMDLFKPKLEALAGVFGAPLSAIEEQVDEVVRTMSNGKHKFDVNAQACCDGKLWLLLDHDNQPLIRIEDDDGGALSMDIAIARLPQGIMIVR
jgi:hypothetical protein